jgi:ribosomal protein L5
MLEVVSGQKAVYRKPRTYRKTSSCFVTLRGQRMWDFLAIFSQIVLPRLSQNTITKGAQSNINSLHVLKLRDEGGNLIFYMKDLFLFPQFEATGQLEGIEDYLPRIFGMSLSFSSTSKTKVEKRLLLESLQIPLDCS